MTSHAHGGPSASERLRRTLAERTGLDLSGRRGDAFRATLDRAASAAGDPDGETHARALLEGRRPITALVDDLTVGETWFFRDRAQWQFLETVAIPDGRARRRRGAGGFAAWSAGCATGEEPYSLAIALYEAGMRDGLHLVGTDLNETALERARSAEYSLWSLRGDATGRARRWLREAAGKLVLAPEIARLVRFFPLSLAGADYPSASRGLAELDVVLCRNVLIYLDPGRVPDVARRLFASLAPGGWLLTGASDPILSRHAPFDVTAGPHGLAYRRPAAVARAAAPAAGRREIPASLRATAAAASRTPARAPARAARPVRPVRRAETPAPPIASSARALLDAGRPAEALAALDAGLARRPLDAEGHFERAVALTELGRLDDAEDACRRALYLARGQPFVHFFTGMLRLRRGDAAGAARAFRTAEALAARRAPGEEVPWSHGMTAAALVEAARAAPRGGWPAGTSTLG